MARDVIAAYHTGKTTVDLAAELDVTPCTVAVFLRRHSQELRGRSEINARRAPLDESLLRSLVDGCRTIPEIAAQTGVSTATIERRMRRLGLRSKHGHGSPNEKNCFWRGGRSLDCDGYVLVKCPDHPYADNRGYVREHRLVMERMLGRYLLPTEIVHHRNGQKADNAPDNLEVLADNSVHFLREHANCPRDAQTGRFLSRPDSHPHPARQAI